jgi:hypothetical protein
MTTISLLYLGSKKHEFGLSSSGTVSIIDLIEIRPVVRELKHADTDTTRTGFLLSLFFDPDDGGNMFLRNVG